MSIFVKFVCSCCVSGITDSGRVTIDSMNPKTEDDFKEFGKLLKEKILKFQQSNYYVDFLDELFQACSLDRKY